MGAALLNYKREKRKENIYFSWLNASRLTLDERVPGSFMLKIIAAIFDFYRSGRLGIERNLYQWMGEGGGGNDRRKGMGECGPFPFWLCKIYLIPPLGLCSIRMSAPSPFSLAVNFYSPQVPKYQDQLYSNKLAYHQHYEKLVFSNGMN